MTATRITTLLTLAIVPMLYATDTAPRELFADVPGLVKVQGPAPFSFSELVTLATVDPPPPDLKRKLDTLLSEPFVSNEATSAGTKPKRPTLSGIGPIARIAEWNINRGENQEQVRQILTGAAQFEAAAPGHEHPSSKKLRKLHDQLRVLEAADVIVLDEVDHGVKRTNYRNVARDLAQALHMNYAYGVEFIELDRIYLGAKNMDKVDVPRQSRKAEVFGVNPRRYLGLEGTAILSRYPIQNARIVRLPEAYDWYHQEIKAISNLEQARRWSAETLFEERIRRQVRRGGRMVLIADLAIAESPTGILTVVCPHLEDYAPSTGHREQMDSLLEAIRANADPLVMAVDLNTTGHDGRPVTIKRLLLSYLGNYRFWVRQAFYFFVPAPGLGYILRGVNYFKNFHDPTAIDIPIFASNHEKQLFENARDFRFNDGSNLAFDESPERSFHHKGRTLADSNQRAWKGFVTTFSFARTYHGLVGEYKVDWFFVKPAERLFSPHYGRTLQDLNTAFDQRISDHSPITVDLPLVSTRQPVKTAVLTQKALSGPLQGSCSSSSISNRATEYRNVSKEQFRLPANNGRRGDWLRAGCARADRVSSFQCQCRQRADNAHSSGR